VCLESGLYGPSTPVSRDSLKLHFVVFLWGLTGPLGKLISLPSPELVFFRTLIAFVALLVIIRWRKVPFALRLSERLAIAGVGMIMGIHWLLFFLSIKISNVSVCMAGFATIAMWISILEPLLVKGRRFERFELVISLVAVLALWLIFRFQFDQWKGLVVSLACALFGALFSIINGRLVLKYHYLTISCHEMAGGCLVCLLGAFVFEWIQPDGVWLALPTSGSDIGWLLVLALACTVYAFSEYIELLNRMSVFTISLTNNLEPVYGIVIGAAVFHEHETMTPGFYAGTLLILASVFAYPFLVRASRRWRGWGG